ncbi:hypothetical protein [Streptomyces liangshanensis]|uniref:Uncharacterized protein n=1 Tax=Streptomyces liangshanensis TaxID=2717324 RepID=A0A6G9GS04_9ACTN|nr:hypothetical protein [Streptomyces liangshanensis]QIQ01038.1 hypothetical protein HA039_00880 [Streptomyces liangshanensis]
MGEKANAGAGLVRLALSAAGGAERWSRTRTVRGRLRMRGPTWDRVGQPGILDGVGVEVDLRQQRTVFTGFTGPARRGVYTPDRVTVEQADGTALLTRDQPRKAYPVFEAHARWDALHALHFAGYGLWNYLTAPLLLTVPGVGTEELDPVEVNGERWRRLRVTFPESVVTHSSPQTWYFGEDGTQRRLDYAPHALGGLPAAHLTEAHRSVSGLVFPTHRYVLPRPPGGPLGSTPVITVDLDDLTVEFDDVTAPPVQEEE